jgi:hypothetical protein
MSSWKAPIKLGCGFAIGCAIGWATTHALFNNEGFTMVSGIPTFKVQEDGYWYRLGQWSAVCEFFELSYNHAERLFVASHYPSNALPTQVAARIREFVGVDA